MTPAAALLTQRAQRFSTTVLVLWRPHGQPTWVEGLSVNASRSGILFRSDQFVAVGTEVELIVALSRDLPADFDIADIRCVGHISRVSDERQTGRAPAIAATIECHSFLRYRGGQDPDARTTIRSTR
jgi:hypothetical protein